MHSVFDFNYLPDSSSLRLQVCTVGGLWGNKYRTWALLSEVWSRLLEQISWIQLDDLQKQNRRIYKKVHTDNLISLILPKTMVHEYVEKILANQKKHYFGLPSLKIILTIAINTMRLKKCICLLHVKDLFLHIDLPKILTKNPRKFRQIINPQKTCTAALKNEADDDMSDAVSVELFNAAFSSVFTNKTDMLFSALPNCYCAFYAI